MPDRAAPVVDAQVHIWAGGRCVTPADAHHLQDESFDAQDLLVQMDAAGVDAAVLVPPRWGGNGHALAAASRHPLRLAVMGRLTAADVPDLGAFLARHPGLIGLRLVFNAERRDWLTSGGADWIWPQAEKAGLPVMLLAPGLLDQVGVLAARHPGLRLAVDHLGMPRHARGADAFAHLPELLSLARLPNVSVKATGLPAVSSGPFPFRDVSGPLKRVFEAFGPDRFFWGSDLTRMPCSYRECVTHFLNGLEWLEEPARGAVMGASLCKWLGWTGPLKHHGPA